MDSNLDEDVEVDGESSFRVAPGSDKSPSPTPSRKSYDEEVNVTVDQDTWMAFEAANAMERERRIGGEVDGADEAAAGQTLVVTREGRRVGNGGDEPGVDGEFGVMRRAASQTRGVAQSVGGGEKRKR